MKYLKYCVYVAIIISCILLLNVSKTVSESIHIPVAEAVVVDMWNDPLFKAIGGCESVGDPLGEWNYRAKNKNSSASGPFQFINSSWYYYGRQFWGEEFYKKNIWTQDSVELAWYVYKKNGTKDWEASRPCWGKYELK